MVLTNIETETFHLKELQYDMLEQAGVWDPGGFEVRSCLFHLLAVTQENHWILLPWFPQVQNGVEIKMFQACTKV